jgi:hypothetical protein
MAWNHWQNCQTPISITGCYKYRENPWEIHGKSMGNTTLSETSETSHFVEGTVAAELLGR